MPMPKTPELRNLVDLWNALVGGVADSLAHAGIWDGELDTQGEDILGTD